MLRNDETLMGGIRFYNFLPVPLFPTDGSGGAIITWMDDRSGNVDIYAQHVTKDGELK